MPVVSNCVVHYSSDHTSILGANSLEVAEDAMGRSETGVEETDET